VARGLRPENGSSTQAHPLQIAPHMRRLILFFILTLLWTHKGFALPRSLAKLDREYCKLYLNPGEPELYSFQIIMFLYRLERPVTMVAPDV
jgi:hypothetical protein